MKGLTFSGFKRKVIEIFVKIRESYNFAIRDPRRWWRTVLTSALSEFFITTLYAMSSIIVGVLVLGMQDTNTWYEAARLNASQGELIIVSLALIGPLAYAVVADPPIKYRNIFQLVIGFFAIFGICVYVAIRLLENVDQQFVFYSSYSALILALALNLFTIFDSQSRKRDPADKMRDSTLEKASKYAEYVRGRG